MNRKVKDYISGANWLTRQERMVLWCIMALLLIGWAVRSYRTANPPTPIVEQVGK